MIKTSIIGATGYTGYELVRLLLRHKDVDLVNVASKSFAGEKIADIYPSLKGQTDLTLKEPNINEFSDSSDVIFLALPHGIASQEVTPEILEKSVIIDLGADFRFDSLETYEQWYQVKNEAQNLFIKATYGLVELNREKIRKSRLIGNPGCYTTTSILALAPLLKEKIIDPDSIVIDAASGVTGAGRGLKLDNLYCEVDEDFKAYGLIKHRHTPEIEQELSKIYGKRIKVNFTPHLVPMQRGILATCYATINENIKEKDIREIFHNFYKSEYFIRLLKEKLPQTKYVKGSNFVDLNFKLDPRTNRIIVLSALDNLIKGASGQAVQNMNVIFNLNEREGIDMIPDSLI